MSSNSKPLTLSTTTAQASISPQLRNTIYSLLLSGPGIPNIQSTLEHELATSGFISNLKAYITSLLRSGECTTLDQVTERVLQKVSQGIAAPNGTNGVNGTANGVNGYKADADDEIDLRVPERAVREGVRVVRRELERVCDVTVEGEDK
ncbi:hypothetical protein CC78DRAFT_549255 [Lojkania enalia]|uniref:Uncharacterized protein n=1 Tax=Lojkania enalia TaxID=147567 RepID=A0A9P4K165_9PLEO|nr:hypothetical protein CC78DRAFT_549255 [Didymosphaeria enalia]